MMLKDKKILVVGAGGLLGASLVRGLIAEGAKVIAADLTLERLRSSLESVGGSADAVIQEKIDLSDKNAVIAMFGRLNGLTGAVNCSYPRNAKYGRQFFDVAPEDFNENVSLNLGSSFLFMQQCAAYFLLAKTQFSLVNISSVYGCIAPNFKIYEDTPMTMPVEYAAIKAGLNHLSKYVTKYIGDSRFRVNLVSPGGISDSQPDGFSEAYKKHTFGKGMLDAHDVVGPIIYLLSDHSKYVNGQNIVVDDGLTL